jgi:hypothetical protein
MGFLLRGKICLMNMANLTKFTAHYQYAVEGVTYFKIQHYHFHYLKKQNRVA